MTKLPQLIKEWVGRDISFMSDIYIYLSTQIRVLWKRRAEMKWKEFKRKQIIFVCWFGVFISSGAPSCHLFFPLSLSVFFLFWGAFIGGRQDTWGERDGYDMQQGSLAWSNWGNYICVAASVRLRVAPSTCCLYRYVSGVIHFLKKHVPFTVWKTSEYIFRLP